MNLPCRYWHPDENSPMADELSHDDKLWCVRRLEPDWALYWPTVDAAFAALEYRPEMARLIEEVDEDNRAAADSGETPYTDNETSRRFLPEADRRTR